MLEDLGAKFQLSQKIIPRFEFQYDHLEIFFWKEKMPCFQSYVLQKNS